MVRSHGFGSTAFASAFTGKHAEYDSEAMRSAAVAKLQELEASADPAGGPKSWNEDPIVTVVERKPLEDDGATTRARTVDAFFKENGAIVHCSPAQMDTLIARFTDRDTYGPASAVGGKDLRKAVRDAEAEIISGFAGEIIANQAHDFRKQDGVTEIEESVEANPVDHVLNDQLLADEAEGTVFVNRAPAFVGCVSNFSNFLDLFRKTLRLVEVGVPCIILSRSNTTQHHYRWFTILDALFEKNGIDARMLTYVAADIEQQRRLLTALSKDSAMYFTGSRPVADKIKEVLPRLMASTGGPNTMVAVEGVTPNVEQAMRWSVGIENSGQCTAMRHLIAPGVGKDKVDDIFAAGKVDVFKSPVDALSQKAFAGLFEDWNSTFPADVAKAQKEQSADYKLVEGGASIAFKIGDQLPYGIVENWRRAYLDVTTPSSSAELSSEEYLKGVAKWLLVEQPIVLAINGDSSAAGFPVTRMLFENTSQVVYSVGETKEGIATGSDPACLTCQARPQDGEIFGEFPPRKQLTKYTRFPVTVPSSTAGYNAEYSEAYLTEKAQAAAEDENTKAFASATSSPKTRGYLWAIAEYLADCTAENPKTSPLCPRGPKRTAMWGVQRPPFIMQSAIRAGAATTVDEVLPYLLPFWLTNAREQVEVSVDPANTAVAAAVSGISASIVVKTESAEELAARQDNLWNVVDLSTDTEKFGVEQFPLAGPFVSLIFPEGHIKSAYQNDAAFKEALSASPKWLKMHQ